MVDEQAIAVNALRRLAFLMERQLADSYRIKAFRQAAAALLDLAPEEFAQVRREANWTRLRGIGQSSAGVIAAALDGEPSSYVVQWESDSGPLAPPGPTKAALRGDLHTHSDWSDGGSPIEEMVMTAVELGREYVVLTDHSPRLRVANGLSAERLRRQLDVVAALNQQLAPSFAVLTGIEVDILKDGALDQDDALLAELDVRVASVHSELKMPAEQMTQRMLRAIAHPGTNVLGHCTGRLIRGGRGTRPQSQFDAERVFAACAEYDVAVEINSRPERCDPPDDLLEVALAAGCRFAVNSDAHAPGQLDFLDYGAARADHHGIPAERIVNTWTRAELVKWAAAKY